MASKRARGIMENMRDWGEDNFIGWLTGSFTTPGLLQGIGDDCAVIPITSEKAWVVTTDALVEDIHFLKNKISAFDLGYKTIMVNLSDIAAMGARPQYCLLSMGIPAATERDWIQDFMKGLKEACLMAGVFLVGGDTTGSPTSLFLNITAIGEASLNQIKYRHTGKPGDIICVTGFLGDSGAGLRILHEERAIDGELDYLLNTHVRPRAHIKEGQWLGSQPAVKAMMDVSDGIEQDLSKLLKSSHCGADIQIELLPCSEALQIACQEYDWDLNSLALTGGEDYCLMCTIPADLFPKVAQDYVEYFGRQIFQIGQLTNTHTGVVYHQHGLPVSILQNRGFNHFQ